MSTPCSRARPIQSMITRALPSRSPTTVLTCTSPMRISRATPPCELRVLSPMSYFDRLRALSKDRDSLLCVGLDPDPERIAGGAAGALRHCREVVRQTEEHVCCFKPNSAFWEQYGADGWHALLELREEAPAG